MISIHHAVRVGTLIVVGSIHPRSNQSMTDIVPCIAWGQVAMLTGRMEVGDTLALEGRVQSRVYTKVVDGCAQERTAFEVSVMHLLEDSEV